MGGHVRHEEGGIVVHNEMLFEECDVWKTKSK